MKTILSVDDDPMILKCFQEVLSHRGYRILTTADPMEAPRLLDEHPVDLLLLDVHMPQKDGLMLFEELKKRNRILPVLFVTGYPGSFSLTSNRMSQIWTEYFGDGNADILYKPFTVEHLYEKVEMLIGPSEKSEA